MSSDNEYNFPYRTNFELRIIFVWAVISILIFICPYVLDVPEKVYQIMAGLSAATGILVGANGIEIYIKKSRLKGYPLTFIEPDSDETLKMFKITDKEILKNVKEKR